MAKKKHPSRRVKGDPSPAKAKKMLAEGKPRTAKAKRFLRAKAAGK